MIILKVNILGLCDINTYEIIITCVLILILRNVLAVDIFIGSIYLFVDSDACSYSFPFLKGMPFSFLFPDGVNVATDDEDTY